MLRELAPQELKQWLDNKEIAPFLLDVREPFEYEIANIKGSTLIPMQSIPDQLEKLPTDKPIICICHHGGRSLQVANFLVQAGKTQIFNLTGGIDLWSKNIDNSIARY